jgi:hypothetical protein
MFGSKAVLIFQDLPAFLWLEVVDELVGQSKVKLMFVKKN